MLPPRRLQARPPLQTVPPAPRLAAGLLLARTPPAYVLAETAPCLC
jgi:hypothetical protein